MFKKLLSLIILNIFFVSTVFANNSISAKIDINKNVASIKLNNIPNDITSIQIDIKDENKNSNTNFAPSTNFDYAKLIEQKQDNYTILSILIQNNDEPLATNGSLTIGNLNFSNTPKLNSSISIELSNIDNDIVGEKQTITATINIDNSNNGGDNGNNGNGEDNGNGGDNGNNNGGNNNGNTGGSSNTGNTSGSGSGSAIINPSKPETENNKPEQNNKPEYKFDLDKEYPVIKEVNFSDITTHWANESITFLAQRGIINGVSETQFLPNNNIKRSEFVKLLAKMDNIDESKFRTNKFSDVSENAWFNPYVAWAEQTGITSGISQTQFAPNENISREQMAVMIKRFSEYKNFKLEPVNEQINFKDNTNISSYALDAISSVQKAGIINGLNDQTFRPKSNATRAEAAKMLHYLIIKQ